jgi:hypothetical protein
MATLLVPALVACGGGSGRGAGSPPTARASTSAGSDSTSHTSASPFVAHTASAQVASWHLPYAAGRQALVPLGAGHVLVAGGLLAGGLSTDRVVRVDTGRGRTSVAPPLAIAVHDVAGGLAGGVPIVVGGGNSSEQDVVQSLRAGIWHVVGHLPTTRSDLSVVPDGRTPLVIGGYDGGSTPTAVLALNARGSTRTRGRLVSGVRYAATAVAGHTAYVFGGEVLGRELDTVQAVDLRTGRASVVARLPVPLGHAMAASVGGRILLMGGRLSPDRQTSAMWWFDRATAHFSRAGNLPRPLSDSAVTTNRRRVWLLGGEDPSVTSDVVFVKVR